MLYTAAVARRNRPLLAALHGHAYTVGPRLWYGRKLVPPPSVRWETSLQEGDSAIAISGELSEPPDAETLVLLMHGCGGTPNSHYIVLAARHFFDRGYAVLRLAWRGADGSGEDLYHAAQTAEVHAALAAPRFARYKRLWLIGYSLGGHCVLHAAHQLRDPRVRGVAAICPVLHLHKTNEAIDHTSRAFYRRYVLSGLIRSYAEMAKRGRGDAPNHAVRNAKTFRAYDQLTVVPRYGFASVDDYYDRACVSHVLHAIETPTLVVAARNDPMLPWQIAEAVRPRMSKAITFRWAERGGHAGFPRDLSIGVDGPLGIEAQVEHWLLQQ
ncbi:MAG: hypothetical protein RL385_3368 [Pseudomonadota bacterium]